MTSAILGWRKGAELVWIFYRLERGFWGNFLIKSIGISPGQLDMVLG